MTTKQSAFAFTADAKIILQAGNRVAKALGAANAVEILRGIHLSLDQGDLVLWATDMSFVLKERIPVDKATQGECVILDAKSFLKALSTMDGEMKFRLIKDILEVSDRETKLRFELGKVEDFPSDPSTAKSKPLAIVETEEFLRAYATVRMCYSNEYTRPILQNILLEVA